MGLSNCTAYYFNGHINIKQLSVAHGILYMYMLLAKILVRQISLPTHLCMCRVLVNTAFQRHSACTCTLEAGGRVHVSITVYQARPDCLHCWGSGPAANATLMFVQTTGNGLHCGDGRGREDTKEPVECSSSDMIQNGWPINKGGVYMYLKA